MSVLSPLPLICERTILRRLSDTDLARFQAYRADPQVARFQGWEQMTDTEALSFIRSVSDDELLRRGSWSQIGIADRSSGILIGDIGIYVNSEEHEAEIGFSLDRHYQRQGLGKETVSAAIHLIFEQTRVKRIIGITDERNVASISLLKALGMEISETNETVFRGENCTELTFSLLRDSVSVTMRNAAYNTDH